MINNLINDIEQAMLGVLNNEQMSQLRKVLEYTFRNTSVSMKSSEVSNENDNKELVGSFLSAKRVEGCSGKSIHYYRSTLNNAIQNIGKNVRHIRTDDLRNYLYNYQQISGATKVTVDNIDAYQTKPVPLQTSWKRYYLCSYHMPQNVFHQGLNAPNQQ